MRAAFFFRIAALGLVVATSRVARADLRGEMTDARAGLEANRALVALPAPVFLEAGGTTVLEPSKLVSSQDACVTLVVLGARTTQFTVVRGAADEVVDDLFVHLRADHDPRQEEAAGGLYVRTLCKEETKGLERAAIRMRSARGTLEMLVARTGSLPATLADLVAARDPGPSAPASDPGPALEPLPIEARKKRTIERERERGAKDVATVAMKSSEAGTGEFDLHVGAGCHSFDVLSGAAGGLDLDADLRDPASGATLAIDHGEAPDAHLETCVPEAGNVVIGFTGAGHSSEVFVTDALFAWPRWITARWTPRVATTWANLSRRRKTPEPTLPPIAETLGGQGRAISAVPVEPGRCYLAMVALSRGRSRGLRLTASASRRPSTEESGAFSDGASVVFCSEDRDVARVEVDAPGTTNWWVLSVWPLGKDGGGEP